MLELVQLIQKLKAAESRGLNRSLSPKQAAARHTRLAKMVTNIQATAKELGLSDADVEAANKQVYGY